MSDSEWPWVTITQNEEKNMTFDNLNVSHMFCYDSDYHNLSWTYCPPTSVLIFLEIPWGVFVHFNLTDPITPALRRVLLLVLCFNQFRDHGRYGGLKSSKTLNTTKTLERPKDWKTIFVFFAPDFSASDDVWDLCCSCSCCRGQKLRHFDGENCCIAGCRWRQLFVRHLRHLRHLS